MGDFQGREKRILITGGAGFIGSHLVDAFLADGYTVAVIDNLSTGHRHNLEAKPAQLFEIDIADRETVRRVVAEFKPTVLSHHAAQVSVRHSLNRPGWDAAVNIVGTINLLEAAVESAVNQFVFASSGGAVYGERTEGANSEADAVQPLSPYGLSKAAAESYIQYFCRTAKLPATILRYSNVYGPRQTAAGEAGVIAIFLEQLHNKRPLNVYGTGEQSRDFVFVGDLVRANLRAVSEQARGIYNISSGQTITINQLAQQCCQIWHDLTGQTPAPALYQPPIAGEVFRSEVANQRAQTVLGWQPTTSLTDGLMATALWLAKERQGR